MKNMTFLFSDIRGFTSISERFKSNPQGLTKLINRFLTPMTDTILARRGTIDKYMGDCIMAFWNAPLDNAEHAAHACAAALAMVTRLDSLNADLAAEAAAQGQPAMRLNIGIGVNTGDCVVGNMGSEQRFDYSVLGDAVNLASRLEGQSKNYGVTIVVGTETREQAHDLAFLELDLIAVKGKKEAVKIYTLHGDRTVAEAPVFQALRAKHEAMLAAYRQQDWAGARAWLGECRPLDPRLADFYDIYEERLDYFEQNPPGADWDGVYVATSK
jgi:adenylate cyclase